MSRKKKKELEEQRIREEARRLEIEKARTNNGAGFILVNGQLLPLDKGGMFPSGITPTVLPPMVQPMAIMPNVNDASMNFNATHGASGGFGGQISFGFEDDEYDWH